MGCPAHFLAEQEVAYRVLRLATVQASGHLEGRESYWSRDGRYSLRVGQDGDVWTAPALAPGTHQLVSTTGVWRTWSCDEVAGQSAHTRKAIIKAIINTMARKEHTLEYLQEKWADITLPIHPLRYPTVGKVLILQTASWQPGAEGRVHSPWLDPSRPGPMEASLRGSAYG